MAATKYFSLEMSIEEIRKAFRKYCLELHPDKGGDAEEFKAMKNEYDQVIVLLAAGEAGKANAQNRKAHFTAETETALRETLEKLLNIAGITVEICGSWLWIYGNTYPVHEQIKALGCKYSSQKKAWYWAADLAQGKARGRYNSLAKIRAKFGSEVIESEAEEMKLVA